MHWIEYLVLGVVQGITEFLPISSDGHLNVVQKLFAAATGHDRSPKDTLFFFVMLHVGTTVAILVHYRRAIADSIRGWRETLPGSADNPEVAPVYRRPNLIHVMKLAFVATLPLVPDALFLKKYLEASFEGVRITALGFLISAVMLAVCGRLPGGTKGPRETSLVDALLVGIAQMFAPLPGVSRSGLTISAALALGFSRTWAVGFSLLMAVPAILGAAVYELRKVDPSLVTQSEIARTIAATIVAGVVGYFAIIWLLRIVQKGGLWYFSVYLVGLALVLLVFAPAMGGRAHGGRSATLEQSIPAGTPRPTGARSSGGSFGALDRTEQVGLRATPIRDHGAP
jgi:undecaprenyl-diphosphatase